MKKYNIKIDNYLKEYYYFKKFLKNMKNNEQLYKRFDYLIKQLV